MARVLVTESLAEAGLAALRGAGHEVDVALDLTPGELVVAVKGAAALVVRSATTVDEAVLTAGTDLVIVGRAGVGVDNVDVDAATRLGVMVANAPGSNAVSTAEHTMALLLAQARNIPQSHASLKDGRWEKSLWGGVELHGKCLGIVGLGRIGSLVAQRALSFGMRLVVWDPWLAPDRAKRLGVELVELDALMAEADFITVHLLKTNDSVGLIDDDLLAKAKPGVRIVNAARGGIIDEAALARALASGQVAGAALDVYETEPCTDSPLFGFDQVVVTPHLSASTPDAQDKAGVVIAEQVNLALAGAFVPFAVNVAASEAAEVVQPYLPLAERLGSLFVALNEGAPAVLEVDYQGQLAEYDTRILTLSVLKGVLDGLGEKASYVNAPELAAARGMDVRDTATTESEDFVNLLTIRGGDHAVAGTLAGARGEPRIVMLDDHTVEVPPARHMLVVRNDDRPGMIGLVTTSLGEAGINISDLHLGVSPATGELALQVLALDQPAPPEVLARLRATDGIVSVHPLE